MQVVYTLTDQDYVSPDQQSFNLEFSSDTPFYQYQIKIWFENSDITYDSGKLQVGQTPISSKTHTISTSSFTFPRYDVAYWKVRVWTSQTQGQQVFSNDEQIVFKYDYDDFLNKQTNEYRIVDSSERFDTTKSIKMNVGGTVKNLDVVPVDHPQQGKIRVKIDGTVMQLQEEKYEPEFDFTYSNHTDTGYIVSYSDFTNTGYTAYTDFTDTGGPSYSNHVNTGYTQYSDFTNTGYTAYTDFTDTGGESYSNYSDTGYTAYTDFTDTGYSAYSNHTDTYQNSYSNHTNSYSNGYSDHTNSYSNGYNDHTNSYTDGYSNHANSYNNLQTI